MKKLKIIFIFIIFILTENAISGPLHMAAGDNDINRIRLLIAGGEDTEVKNSSGKTPLTIAREKGNTAAVEFLTSIATFIIPGGSRYTGQHRGRLEHGWGAYFGSGGWSYVGYFREGKFHGLGVWRYASGARFIGEFREGTFLEGERITVTPLDVAVQKGSTRVVKILIASGIDVNSLNSAGQSPLHFSAFEGRDEIAQILIDSGAIIGAHDNMGQTPLHYACYMGHPGMAALLIQGGADVNSANSFGTTPLHYAVYQDSPDVAEILLDNGANLWTKDSLGYTPVMHARKLKSVKFLQFIKTYQLKNK